MITALRTYIDMEMRKCKSYNTERKETLQDLLMFMDTYEQYDRELLEESMFLRVDEDDTQLGEMN